MARSFSISHVVQLMPVHEVLKEGMVYFLEVHRGFQRLLYALKPLVGTALWMVVAR